MQLYNFNTDKYQIGPIKKGKYFVKERGIIMVPEIPVTKHFLRNDGAVIEIQSVDFATDIYTIKSIVKGIIETRAVRSEILVKKLMKENWKLQK